MTDDQFTRLLAEATERPEAVEALRVAEDAWQASVGRDATPVEAAAWRFTRNQAAHVLLERWQPNGRTHDLTALQTVAPERRNQTLEDSLLLALGGTNVLTVMVKDARPDDASHRVFVAALREVGKRLADSLRRVREEPPAWV